MVAFDTGFPADSLEFCPHPQAYDIFTCGTYKLDESSAKGAENSDSIVPSGPQHRRGRCLVFQLDDVRDKEHMTFHKLQTFDLPAVLDMKWCHRSQSSNPVVGIADSEGNITLNEWDINGRVMQCMSKIQCTTPDVLCLSLDWSNRRSPGSDLGSLVVSLSNGSLSILRPTDGFGLSVTDTWLAHDYEPWIAAWNYWDTNILYSGGDDLKLKAWDVRQGFMQPTFTNKRFDAGITSIQSHPYIDNLIAVGSYNNIVQLFDIRKPLTSIAQVDVGGGAWRVKWHPSASRKDDLLVACMHDGFKVVTFNFDSPGIQTEIKKRFDLHSSLAYGVDWSFGPSIGDESVIGSCSFYDHSMYVWTG
ncbi:WD40-repeat-containing domain protein [Crucibulum laeve]|uniref:methylated diphthine methylhydrolase n=1 Tax=Crucibulum laeve TaxID=68775 RepID=A0A5C3M764_9AGAR|nr:WD40-repeat-containing domain protein [Crucibulum laeve]